VRSDEVRRVRNGLGLTQSQFAELLGVHLVTVKKWETGAQGMRAPVERLIKLLAAKEATRPKTSKPTKKRPKPEGPERGKR
jgi:DNA-binding transcriptional regulator YiaG